MTYVRAKVADWEKYDDGEWHEIRRGPDEEERSVSFRQYRRHWESLAAWSRINHRRGQLSRRDHGRILRVRITPAAPADAEPNLSGRLPEVLRSIGRVVASNPAEASRRLRALAERLERESEKSA